MNEFADVADALARRMPELAAHLFPSGRRRGADFRVGSIAGEAGGKLSITLAGPKAGRWKDYPSGEGGDAVALVAAARCNGSQREALSWARAWLGLDNAGRPDDAPRRAAAPADKRADERASKRTACAMDFWLQAAPAIKGTPVDKYLKGRGIDLARLGFQPAALRFHPWLPNSEAGRTLPAMVAAISGPDGTFTGLHRTWLAETRGSWGKAPLAIPKASLGTVAGGTIRLCRGAGGLALELAPQGSCVVLAEGIETGLSLALLVPGVRVLAAISVGNLAAVKLPPAISEIILAADNDAPLSQATLGLQRAIDKFTAEGRTVRVARSPAGKDFNDALVVAGR